jgi:uncharacterized protein YdeI (YjbR/CyaY-like superfamily)
MAITLIELDIRTRKAWRAWLAKNHTSSPGVWLVRHKDHTGVSSVPYEDLVREALCVGWIDSLVRRLDDDRYAIKVTPRKPTSKWSALNRKRYAELKDAGLLKSAGLANSPAGKPLAQKPSIVIPELPDYIASAIKQHPAAWQYFQTLAPSHRRHYVGWIHIAKRPETREKRLRESIALLSKGQKLGLK